MQQAHSFTVNIGSSAQKVFDFIREPANLPSWTMARDGRREPLAGPLVWSFEGPRGTTLAHFTILEDARVVDFIMRTGNRVTVQGHARVLACSGEGAVLVLTLLQPPGVSAETFQSEHEWTQADLHVLKSLLEN